MPACTSNRYVGHLLFPPPPTSRPTLDDVVDELILLGFDDEIVDIVSFDIITLKISTNSTLYAILHISSY